LTTSLLAGAAASNCLQWLVRAAHMHVCRDAPRCACFFSACCVLQLVRLHTPQECQHPTSQRPTDSLPPPPKKTSSRHPKTCKRCLGYRPRHARILGAHTYRSGAGREHRKAGPWHGTVGTQQPWL
jgi:hypothetical protein